MFQYVHVSLQISSEYIGTPKPKDALQKIYVDAVDLLYLCYNIYDNPSIYYVGKTILSI